MSQQAFTIIFVLGLLLAIVIIQELCYYIPGMLFWKVYTKVYNPDPQMHLDRKYGVKYKYHWWQKWKYYIPKQTFEGEKRYENDLTYYQAVELAEQIKTYGI